MVGRTGSLGLRPRPAGRCAKHNAVSLRSARTYTASHPVLALQYIILVLLESMKNFLDGGSYRIRTCDQLIKSQLLYRLS
jgi:hypothetical protein